MTKKIIFFFTIIGVIISLCSCIGQSKSIINDETKLVIGKKMNGWHFIYLDENLSYVRSMHHARFKYKMYFDQGIKVSPDIGIRGQLYKVVDNTFVPILEAHELNDIETLDGKYVTLDSLGNIYFSIQFDKGRITDRCLVTDNNNCSLLGFLDFNSKQTIDSLGYEHFIGLDKNYDPKSLVHHVIDKRNGKWGEYPLKLDTSNLELWIGLNHLLRTAQKNCVLSINDSILIPLGSYEYTRIRIPEGKLSIKYEGCRLLQNFDLHDDQGIILKYDNTNNLLFEICTKDEMERLIKVERLSYRNLYGFSEKESYLVKSKSKFLTEKIE